MYIVASAVLRFAEGQHFTVKPRIKLSTVADDIHFQFRTRHAHGALLNTRSHLRRTGLDIFLYLGKLYVQVTLAGTEHVSCPFIGETIPSQIMIQLVNSKIYQYGLQTKI